MSEQNQLLALFREELEGALPRLQELVLALESGEGGRAEGQEAMRLAHSLKGAARIVGAASLAAALHAAEDVLTAGARGEPMHPDAMQQLLALLDTLDMAAARPAGELPMWLAQHTEVFGTAESRLRAAASRRGGDGKGDAVTAVDSGEGRTAPSELGPALAVARGAVEDARLQRVSAETLTRLLGIAGEVVVEARRLGAFERGALALARVQSRLDERMGELERRAARSNDAELMTLADMLVADLGEARALANELHTGQSEAVQRLLDVSELLFIEALRVRQRPFAGLLPALRRHVRETSRALGKSARLEVSGSSLLVDGDVLSGLEAVLGHLVTNAIDHGIERESERIRRGKPAQGVVRVEVSQDRAELLVVVSDDGGGVDLEGVREAALSRKLIAPAAASALHASEVLELLFLPGFTTARSLSHLSGRGVGLDSVRNMVRRLGGHTRITSELGRGTRFELILPATRVVARALLVEVAGECYALPLAKIGRVVRVPTEAIKSAEGRPYVALDGENLGLVRADELLGVSARERRASGDELTLIVLTKDGGASFGLVVDRALGEDDLVVQPLDQRLGHVPDVAAGALLADGSPTLLLDADDIIVSIERLARRRRPTPVMAAEQGPRVKRVLVVDDSAVVRETGRMALMHEGYAVEVARDGEEAWKALQGGGYDAMVTDVQMPRLDGLALTERVRRDRRLGDLPIVVLSYRDGEADLQRTKAAGAQAFVSKNDFDDRRLARLVRELIGPAR